MKINDKQKLFLVKLFHTVIWFFFAGLIFFVLLSGMFGVVNNFVGIAIALVIIEGLIIVLNKGKCPLTPIAARYTENRKDNFDIFLPNWLAKYNKLIFTIIFFIGVLLVINSVMS